MQLPGFLASRLSKNPFWRDFTLVAGGSAAGQAVGIVASPLLSRLYSPSDFGLLSVYGSVVSIVAVVSALSYQQAIPAPEKDEDAANLTALSLSLVLISSLVTAIAVGVFDARLERYFGIPRFSRYVAVAPVGVLGLSAYEVLSNWAARKKAFGLIAKTSAQRSLLQTTIQFAGGLGKVGAGGLLVGQLFGQWSGTIQIARRSWREDAGAFRAVTRQTVFAAARKFRRFPMLTLPGAVLNAIDSNAAPLLFAHFFGASITGYYALGHRLVGVPFSLIGNSAQRVFYPAAAVANQTGTLAVETDETYRRLLRLVLPIMCVITACAPELFAVVMGAQWREAGVYLQWQSLRSCFTMLVFPLTPLIFVLNRQVVGTVFSGTQLAVRIGAIYVGARYGSARLAVALLGVSAGSLWLAYLFYLVAISGNRVPRAVWLLLKETAIAIAMASPIVAVKWLHGTDLAVTLTAGAASLVGACVITYRSRAHVASV